MKSIVTYLLIAIVLCAAGYIMIDRVVNLEDDIQELKQDIRDIKKKIEPVAEIEIGYTRVPIPATEMDFGLPACSSQDGWIGCLLSQQIAYYLHGIVIARNPDTGEMFSISAGPSQCASTTVLFDSSISSSERRCCDEKGQLCAEAGMLSKDDIEEINHLKSLQKIDNDRKFTYFELVQNMKKFATEFNKRTENKYNPMRNNSNTFASEFINKHIGDDIIPKPPVEFPSLLPGWKTAKGEKYNIWKVIHHE